jgi:hypothetical protein
MMLLESQIFRLCQVVLSIFGELYKNDLILFLPEIPICYQGYIHPPPTI